MSQDKAKRLIPDEETCWGDPRTPEEIQAERATYQPGYVWRNPFTGEPLAQTHEGEFDPVGTRPLHEAPCETCGTVAMLVGGQCENCIRLGMMG